MASADQLTQSFYQKIPICKVMGLKVTEATSTSAAVSVPLAPNINHVQTAFGGSIYSAAAICCYALFQAISQEAGGLGEEIVIQEGHIQYLAPVTKDFTVQAHLTKPDDAKKFVEGIRRHGRARLDLKAHVLCGGLTCATFEGRYVYKESKT